MYSVKTTLQLQYSNISLLFVISYTVKSEGRVVFEVFDNTQKCMFIQISRETMLLLINNLHKMFETIVVLINSRL
jgi:hypothetical protein